ncbi:hypothetical protein SAMN02745898_11861 [Streptomyces sp. 136MFCol5.1]|uniref:hypothetical protein n=1 Tax=unclassified Streptomyces TaxID=2593676 RepID=UPI00087EEC3D|nr:MULTISPECIES: hypothetical protein [unclassified Streptomyces]SCZ16678.1 hypothetical protein SAMN02745898_11861 [Streptomyces sp. 136MFCol5.1]SFT29946.1 hypothetical protein SAMN04487982_11557 [Streptomyces sp. ok210]
MRHLRELLIDAWSWLNYKQAMADPTRPGQHAFPELNQSWVPAEDLRRLAAYKFLTPYDSNQAGQLAAVNGDHRGVERRELGDPSKLSDTTLGYLLGPEQTLVVPGADHVPRVFTRQDTLGRHACSWDNADARDRGVRRHRRGLPSVHVQAGGRAV